MKIDDSNLTKEDLAKLVKVLEMTSSDNDAEVLVAARKAQKILAKYNTNYSDLTERLRQHDPRHLEKLHTLEKTIRQQKREIEKLKSYAQTPPSKEASPSFLGPLLGLRRFLMNNLSLRTHERALLEGITEVEPKSKEAYLILICARRHGVSYESACS